MESLKKLIKLKIPYLGFVLYIVMCNIEIRVTSKIKMIATVNSFQVIECHDMKRMPCCIWGTATYPSS